MARPHRLVFVLLCACGATRVSAQQQPSSPPSAAAQAARDTTREQLRRLLDAAGRRRDVDAIFRQAETQPYNFSAMMRGDLANAEAFEVVISVTKDATISLRIFPHYKGGYINLDKVRDGPGLMRKLLRFSDSNFFYWGADGSSDVFSGYTFTLESGFPDDALIVVLRSIRNNDEFVGQLRPFIDGSAAVKP